MKRVGQIVYLASGIVLYGLSQASTAANLCEKYVSPPRVNITVANASVRYSPTPIDELQTLEPSADGHDDHGTTLGMTYTNQGNLDVKTTYAVQQIPDGFCVSPQITASLTGQQVTVMVPKELPVDSCLYQETLAHENKHVQALTVGKTALLQQAATTLEQRMNGAYAYFQRLSDAKPWLEKYQTEAYRRFSSAIVAAKAQSDSIDTPEEYKRISDACKKPPEKHWKWPWEK